MTWKLKAEAIEIELMKRGLNLADLARLAGVSQGTLYAAMNGKRAPVLKTISKLAAALEVPATDIAEKVQQGGEDNG